MKTDFRCSCPLTSALDVVGDKWSLAIIKQMLLEEKKTFKDFTESDEAIATNILSARLKMLEEFHIIRKEKLPHNKKINIYVLTEKGLALTPTIVELTLWTSNSLTEYHSTLAFDERLEMMKNHKQETINSLIENYKEQNWLEQGV